MANTVDILGDDAVTDGIISRTIVEIVDDNVVSVGESAFYNCTSLTTADFPMATIIGSYAFDGCANLTTADFPVATTVSTYAFQNCTSLTTAGFPMATIIGNYAFNGCANLTTADFPVATRIGSYAFKDCANLTTLILRKSDAICTLGNTNAFNDTPIASDTGYIYVPANLVDAYKTATNWSTYASQFRALEDYTVDGTITGALDESKI